MGFLDNTGLARVWGKIKTALGGKVDKTTTVNGHALSGNVSVTKRDVGLGNVNNTSDANKPISTATQTALNGKVSTSTTVNGHALSSNVSVTQQDIGIKYSSEPPSNPSDGDIWLQPESASNILHDTDIASSAITGKSTVNAALTQLNSDASTLNDHIDDLDGYLQVGLLACSSLDGLKSELIRIANTLPSNRARPITFWNSGVTDVLTLYGNYAGTLYINYRTDAGQIFTAIVSSKEGDIVSIGYNSGTWTFNSIGGKLGNLGGLNGSITGYWTWGMLVGGWAFIVPMVSCYNATFSTVEVFANGVWNSLVIYEQPSASHYMLNKIICSVPDNVALDTGKVYLVKVSGTLS